MNNEPSESNSAAVMLSVMNIIRFIRKEPSSSEPSNIPCGRPGIMDAILLIGPLEQEGQYITKFRREIECGIYIFMTF